MSTAIEQWLEIPDRVEAALRGVSEQGLDVASAERMSVRETVHHVAEAVFVASHIVLAALAKSGMTYDWSWVMPNREWQHRLGYHRAPLGTSLQLLRALCTHVAALVESVDGGLEKHVQLLDAPGKPVYARTVEEILREQVEHAREHLGSMAIGGS